MRDEIRIANATVMSWLDTLLKRKCSCWSRRTQLRHLISACCTVCRAPRSWWTMKMKMQWNILAICKGDFRNSMGRCLMTEGLRNMSVLDMITSRQKSGALQDIGMKCLVEAYNECSSINGAEHTSARAVAGWHARAFGICKALLNWIPPWGKPFEP